MQEIKHYSFDLWFTLIKSNPKFKEERAKFFHRNFTQNNASLAEVTGVFRQVDILCNATNEKTGGNITAEEMYCMVIHLLNDSLSILDSQSLSEIYSEVEQLIFHYPPEIFNPETYSVLDKLLESEGITMNLLSNTAFIKGITLRKVLHNLELSKYFKFEIYSDEVRMSKPNQDLYQYTFDEIRVLRPEDEFKKKNVLHVGDNPVSDIIGAKNFGFQAFQLNTNNYLISDIPH